MPAPPVPAPGKHVTGPFALSDPVELASLLGAAGWCNVDSESVVATARLGLDAIADDDQLRFVGVPDDRLDEARRAASQQLAAFVQPDGECLVPIAFLVTSALAG